MAASPVLPTVTCGEAAAKCACKIPAEAAVCVAGPPGGKSWPGHPACDLWPLVASPC